MWRWSSWWKGCHTEIEQCVEGKNGCDDSMYKKFHWHFWEENRECWPNPSTCNQMLASDYRNGTWCSEEFICSIIHPGTCSLPQNNWLKGSTQWYKYTLLLQVWSLTYIIHVQGCIYLQIYVRKRKSVIIHTPIAWNVNRMAYNEGGQKMHGRKKGLRMLTYDGEDHEQNKAHKEAVSCNWASLAPPRHSFALRLLHRNRSTPSALEHWWKFGKNHPQATTPACGFPSHALLHVRLYRHHTHILKFPGHIADQICIAVATHDGHPVLAPGYHSLIWITCPNIHVTGQKGEWLDSKQ